MTHSDCDSRSEFVRWWTIHDPLGARGAPARELARWAWETSQIKTVEMIRFALHDRMGSKPLTQDIVFEVLSQCSGKPCPTCGRGPGGAA